MNLAQEVGIARVSAAARRAGITSPLQDYASLALGTNEVTPLELTAAYGTFARGEPVKPYLVSRIETTGGKVIYQQDAPAGQPVIADTVRRDLTAMLYNVVTSGTGTAARLPEREAAGKTGTTQDYRDAWFIGFTSDYVASVWVGNDDNAPMRKVTGGLVPALLWKQMMTVAENGLPPHPLDRTPEPTGVSGAFADEQVSYVDDVDAAAPQLPQDEKGDFVSGSGVSPAPSNQVASAQVNQVTNQVARNEPTAPTPPPAARAPDQTAYAPPQAEPPRARAADTDPAPPQPVAPPAYQREPSSYPVRRTRHLRLGSRCDRRRTRPISPSRSRRAPRRRRPSIIRPRAITIRRRVLTPIRAPTRAMRRAHLPHINADLLASL